MGLFVGMKKNAAIDGAMRHNKGFTLLEIVIVMGLMAFFSLLVLFSWRGGGEVAAIRAGETILLQALCSARQQAVLRQGQSCLLISAAADAQGQYLLEILYRDPGATDWISTGFSRALPRGLQPESVSSSSGRSLLWENQTWQAIEFSSNGQPSTSPGSIVLRLSGEATAPAKGNKTTILLHATGMATVVR